MNNAKDINQFVITLKDKCKVCYSCVRECPAKAIKIINGQAEIMYERCITCGNCIKVCSQKAKQFGHSIERVKELLNSGNEVAAIVAPSIAAEFMDISSYQKFVGMIRALGFTYVNEVAFGAELVAEEYKKLIQKNDNRAYIATNCPALVNFIEKYHGNLTQSLAPIVSPMIAIARVLHHIHGKDLPIVFIGPCIAKKTEASEEQFKDEIYDVISFIELRKLFVEKGISEHNIKASEFDAPQAGKGTIFPISGGMLQTVDLEEDILKGEIVVADGRQDFIEALKEFEDGHLDPKLLDMLCCSGCIMGAGMSNKQQFFTKRKSISNFAKRKIDHLNKKQWKEDLERFSTLDFSRNFSNSYQREQIPKMDEITEMLNKLGKYNPEDELNCGACGYDTCYEHAIAILKGLAEIEMCLPYTIDKLHTYIKELDISNEKLATTQQALKQSEKLASMGQLAAGIAHEVNNPLGVIIMYTHILLDDIDENSPMYKDLSLIVEQADRCKKIVGGLLNFARKSKVSFKESYVSDLISASIKAFIIPENIEIIINNKIPSTKIQIDFDQMTQVFANLIKNSIDAMPKGGIIIITTTDENNEITFSVRDNGTGIAKEHMDKLFEPFFTTKEQGKGTGLGLPIIYGIVKMHKGNIKVESNTDESKGEVGTTFTVTIPKINTEI